MASSKNFISSYLASHQDITKVSIYKYIEAPELEKEILDSNNVTVEQTKAQLNILYYPSTEEAVSFLEKNPGIKTLIVANENINTFSVWEAAKANVPYLLLSVEHEFRNIVCEWEGEKDDIELSVVFPVYNVGKYIEQCIKSVIEWKAPYIEYLFVNDGSSDNSVEIIEKYAKIDSRVKLINKPNGGCASARNKGLENAKGRYVGFIDPDDFIDPTMFKKLFSKAIEGTVDIVWCNFNEYYNNNGESKPALDYDPTPYKEPCYNKEEIIEFIAIRKIAIWRAIYKKSMLDKHDIHFNPALKRFDDLPFKVQTFAYATSIAAINENLYFYRLDREGQDVSANDERLYVHFDIFKMLDEFFKKFNNTRMNNLYEIVKFDTHNWALTKLKPELIREYSLKAKDDLLSMVSIKDIERLLKYNYYKEGAKSIRKILNVK